MGKCWQINVTSRNLVVSYKEECDGVKGRFDANTFYKLDTFKTLLFTLQYDALLNQYIF